jgi:PhoH-like ATPase
MPLFLNQFVVDDEGFTGRVREVTGDNVVLADLKRDALMHPQAWGLRAAQPPSGAGAATC